MCGKTEQISLVRNKDAVLYRLNSDCCMTNFLRQLWEELLPWERTRWHWSKHVKFRPSWQFHKGCLSLHSCQTAILPHWWWHIEHTLPSPPFNQHSFEQWFSLFYEVLSFEKSPWASLGRILALACATTEKHWCPVSTFACFRGRAFLGIPYSSPCVAKLNKTSLVRNKDAVRYRLNSDCCKTILLRQLWEELLPWERTRWHWSKHVKFRPSWLFHKGCLSLQGWEPPHKHNRFQYTVPSHIESCAAHSAGVRVWGKKPGFLERKAYGKENPGSISKASMHDIRFQCQVEKAWMWHVVPVSNHLLDAESELGTHISVNPCTCWHIELSILSTFACFRGRAFLGIPYSSPCVANWTNQFGPKQGCCPLQAKFRLLYDNSFAPALGWAFAVGTNTMALIQTCQIQAIMTVPQRLSFSAGLGTPP